MALLAEALAVERHRQQQMLAMDQRERSLNKVLLEEVRHLLQLLPIHYIESFSVVVKNQAKAAHVL